MVSRNQNSNISQTSPKEVGFEAKRREQYNSQLQSKVASQSKAANSQGITSERARYDKLQQSRINDQKKAMRATVNKNKKITSQVRKRRLRKKKTNLGVNQNTAYAAATAYREISPSEDMAHIIAIVISIGADIGTIIPILNFIVTPLAIMTLWVVYLLGGHWERRVGRKAVVSICSYAVEMFPAASALPMFTIAAVINYQFALVEKRLIKIQKGQI